MQRRAEESVASSSSWQADRPTWRLTMNQMFWIVSWQQISYDNMQPEQNNSRPSSQRASFCACLKLGPCAGHYVRQWFSLVDSPYMSNFVNTVSWSRDWGQMAGMLVCLWQEVQTWCIELVQQGSSTSHINPKARVWALFLSKKKFHTVSKAAVVVVVVGLIWCFESKKGKFLH